jgi:hypothetical protein
LGSEWAAVPFDILKAVLVKFLKQSVGISGE